MHTYISHPSLLSGSRNCTWGSFYYISDEDKCVQLNLWHQDKTEMNVFYVHINGKYGFGSECSLLFCQFFCNFFTLQEPLSRKKDSV